MNLGLSLWTYLAIGAVAATPVLTSASQSTMRAAGGESITLTGTSLSGASVSVGGNAATVTSNSSTQVVITTPAVTPGSVDVIVTTVGGTSNALTWTAYAAPTISSANYATFDNAGGDSITLTGTGFANGTPTVDMSGTSCTVTASSSTTVTFTTPAISTGSKSVTVTTLGGTSGSTSITAYDLDALSMTAWYRNFTVSPATPTTSAGTSGSNGNLTEATNSPSSGATLNSKATSDFDGTNDKLTAATTPAKDTFFSNTTGTVICLINVDTVATNNATATSNESFFGSGASQHVLQYVSDAGFKSALFNGSAFKLPTAIALSTGTWAMTMCRWSDTLFEHGLNAGTPNTIAMGTATSLDATGTLRLGANFNASFFFDGRIAEFMAFNSILNDATVTSIYACLRCRYAL